MTTTTQTAETGTTLFIPLNRLKKSPKNVRKTPHPQADIEALAAIPLHPFIPGQPRSLQIFGYIEIGLVQ